MQSLVWWSGMWCIWRSWKFSGGFLCNWIINSLQDSWRQPPTWSGTARRAYRVNINVTVYGTVMTQDSKCSQPSSAAGFLCTSKSPNLSDADILHIVQNRILDWLLDQLCLREVVCLIKTKQNISYIEFRISFFSVWMLKGHSWTFHIGLCLTITRNDWK